MEDQSSQEEGGDMPSNRQEEQATSATSGNQAEGMDQGRAGNQDQKDGNKKKMKRSPERGHITIGGLKKYRQP